MSFVCCLTYYTVRQCTQLCLSNYVSAMLLIIITIIIVVGLVVVIIIIIIIINSN